MNKRFYGRVALLDWGGLPADTPYFDRNTTLPNVIGSGTKQGNITQQDAVALSLLGFNSAQLGPVGQYTYGFSFDKAYLPTGSFASIFGLECLNDLVAFNGTITPSNSAAVPEPTTMLGLTLAGAGGAFLKRRQNKLPKDVQSWKRDSGSVPTILPELS